MTITAILELDDGRAVAGTLVDQTLTAFKERPMQGTGKTVDAYVIKKPAQVVFIEDGVRNATGEFLTKEGKWVTPNEAQRLGNSKIKIVRVMTCIPFDCEELIVGFDKVAMTRDMSRAEQKEYTNALAPVPGTSNSVLV